MIYPTDRNAIRFQKKSGSQRQRPTSSSTPPLYAFRSRAVAEIIIASPSRGAPDHAVIIPPKRVSSDGYWSRLLFGYMIRASPRPMVHGRCQGSTHLLASSPGFPLRDFRSHPRSQTAASALPHTPWPCLPIQDLRATLSRV